MRHSCATLLLEAGTHPRVVAERLGHSNASLVMNVYGHVTERMQTEATATLDRVLGARRPRCYIRCYRAADARLTDEVDRAFFIDLSTEATAVCGFTR